jgi:uncharacterized protein (DUF427 family)
VNEERIEPGPGQESVWDYPRPPRIEPASSHVRVQFEGETVADSRNALRVLETSQPPAFYIPARDVRMELIRPNPRRTFCEWKGEASYVDVAVRRMVAEAAGWLYEDPVPAFEALRGHYAFYAQLLDCSVDGERVTGNEGTFYGGWITDRVVGPFKGGAGTAGW